jgi:hypothetical protein
MSFRTACFVGKEDRRSLVGKIRFHSLSATESIDAHRGQKSPD